MRFFGGWDYKPADAAGSDPAAVGYGKGIPMGADLPLRSEDGVPTFLAGAMKDPNGANLDRLQVIKGWHDRHGGLHEQVYDVAWFGDRTMGADGRLEPVASTVDERAATYTNAVGGAALATRWVDPDFDPDTAAFYYVRVIEIPTPRWTAYDAARYGIDALPEGTPLVIQERAYSSPIWYTPRAWWRRWRRATARCRTWTRCGRTPWAGVCWACARRRRAGASASAWRGWASR